MFGDGERVSALKWEEVLFSKFCLSFFLPSLGSLIPPPPLSISPSDTRDDICKVFVRYGQNMYYYHCKVKKLLQYPSVTQILLLSGPIVEFFKFQVNITNTILKLA